MTDASGLERARVIRTRLIPGMTLESTGLVLLLLGFLEVLPAAAVAVGAVIGLFGLGVVIQAVRSMHRLPKPAGDGRGL